MKQSSRLVHSTGIVLKLIKILRYVGKSAVASTTEVTAHHTGHMSFSQQYARRAFVICFMYLVVFKFFFYN